MKKRTLIAAIIAVAALVAVPTIAHAQQTPTIKERLTQTERVQEAKAAREARQLNRCEALQTKLVTRAEKVQVSSERHAEIYTKLEARLQKVIDYATSVGYDTAALLAAQTSINEKIDAFTVAADEYSTALTEAKDVTCEDDATPYGEAIVDARDALRNLRESAKAVHTAFRSEAVPALTDFAKSVTDEDETEEETNS